MNKKEIISCLFCGKDADFFEEEWMISCMDSEGGCGFFYNGDGYKREELIKAWNTRATENLSLIVKEQEKSLISLRQEYDRLFEENRALEKDKKDLMANLDSKPKVDGERIEDIIINWLDTEGDQNDSDELAKAIVQELGK